MSQQEFTPEPQKPQKSQEQSATRFYKRSRKTSDTPKSEHPSTYDDAPSGYGYQAQDQAQKQDQASSTRQFTASRTTASRERSSRQERTFSPDGDAFETSYRPYTHYNPPQQVPWWARPQQFNRKLKISQWLLLVLLALLLIPLLAFMVKVIAIIIGVFFVVVLFGLFVVLLLVGFVLLLVFGLLGGMLKRARHWSGRSRWW